LRAVCLVRAMCPKGLVYLKTEKIVISKLSGKL